jgi:hypothetical protein
MSRWGIDSDGMSSEPDAGVTDTQRHVAAGEGRHLATLSRHRGCPHAAGTDLNRRSTSRLWWYRPMSSGGGVSCPQAASPAAASSASAPGQNGIENRVFCFLDHGVGIVDGELGVRLGIVCWSRRAPRAGWYQRLGPTRQAQSVAAEAARRPRPISAASRRAYGVAAAGDRCPGRISPAGVAPLRAQGLWANRQAAIRPPTGRPRTDPSPTCRSRTASRAGTAGPTRSASRTRGTGPGMP